MTRFDRFLALTGVGLVIAVSTLPRNATPALALAEAAACVALAAGVAWLHHPPRRARHTR